MGGVLGGSFNTMDLNMEESSIIRVEVGTGFEVEASRGVKDWLAKEGVVTSKTNTKPTWKTQPRLLTMAALPLPRLPSVSSSLSQPGRQARAGLQAVSEVSELKPAQVLLWNFQVVPLDRDPLFPAPFVAPQYEHSIRDWAQGNA